MPEPSQLADYPIIIQLPIQWGDMDAFRHVNNTVPFRWFESSRIAYLEQTEMERLMEHENLAPILASTTCNYRRQIHYPDTVWIGARVGQLGRSSMTMEHAVVSKQQQAIVVDGTAVVVVFNYETNRPTRIPPEVRAAAERAEGKSLQ